MVHAHHFGAFFVHGHGVEIVHFLIRGRAYRVGGGAGVFRKLVAAQHTHIVDAAHSAAGAVAGKFLVAKNGEPFFERELKPVAAGNAVAGPVVEILVANHRFNAFKIGIGGGGAVGQHVFGVENIQTLVFHGAHIKVAHRHHHIDVEVILEAETGFVPAHGVFERFDGKTGFGLVGGTGVKMQRHHFTGGGGELVLA